MREVDIDIWWEISGEYDSYDSCVEVTDEEYSALVEEIKAHRDEIDPEHEMEEYEGKDFTDCCDGEIYDKIQQQVDKEVRESLIDNCCFDEEEEGCTIEEYIDNNYTWGFYLSDSFVNGIL